MVSIDDVSRKARVSRSTVSRLIAGNGYVSDSARKAVEAAIAELGYRPNPMARGLRSNRSNIIGGVVVDLGSPFYAQMVRGIEEACRNAGRGFLVASGFADRDEEARAIIGLTDRSCDGLILYLENPMREDAKKILARSRAPVVLVGGEARKPWAHVGLDNYGGAYAGMRLLLSKGHKKIAYLSGGLNYHDTHVRLRAIGDALAEAGMGLKDIHVEHGRFEESFGYEATERLLHLGPPVTAIFAGDDDIAAGALLAIKRFGLRVPDDISLLGFDDNFHARHLTPGLTTVRQPIDEAGRAATRLLLDILDNKASAQTCISIPTELILRDSVAQAPSVVASAGASLAATQT